MSKYFLIYGKCKVVNPLYQYPSSDRNSRNVFVPGNLRSHLYLQVPSLFPTSCSLLPVVFLCLYWRQHWASTPVLEESCAGGRSAPCLKVRFTCQDCDILKFCTQTQFSISHNANIVSAMAMQCCLLLPGMGFASQMIIFYGCISYIVILAWALLYFFSSFSAELPWATCNNTWNTGKLTICLQSLQLVSPSNTYASAYCCIC